MTGVLTNEFHGFVDGNFFKGKVKDIGLENNKCWVLAYQQPLLVVGTSCALQFYDSNNGFCLVYELPCRSMISALKPITNNPSIDSDKNKKLATASLDGTIHLYAINQDILECQGPTLLYAIENTTGAQIRSLDVGFYNGNSHRTLVVAAGDKSGALTVATFHETNDSDQPQIQLLNEGTIQLHGPHRKDCEALLGLGISTDQGLLATTTKGGLVQVHNLAHRLDQFFSSSVIVDNWNRPQPCKSNNEALWSMQRNGPVRCASFDDRSKLFAFGGYDKTLFLVCTLQWAVTRELPLDGTINCIEFDPQGRYIGVGCRSKTFTIFDTTTYVAIKVIETPSWVTSIGWWNSSDTVAIRSGSDCVSVYDLSPIQYFADICPSAGERSPSCSLSWSRTGQFLALAEGSTVVVKDAWNDFSHIAAFELGKGFYVAVLSFCRAANMDNMIAAVNDAGHLFLLRLLVDAPAGTMLMPQKDVLIEPNLNVLEWSPDGTLLVAGGRGKRLHILLSDSLKPALEPIVFQGRIWDVDFAPHRPQCQYTLLEDDIDKNVWSTIALAVALGDYTTILLNKDFQPSMKISRSRTCRCLRFHPVEPILAIGDGADTIAILNYKDGDIVTELSLQGRVNDLDFSPCGEFLIAGTDPANFSMFETTTYCIVQTIPTVKFAERACFSPSGRYLALASADDRYKIMRLGPFLGTQFVPLDLDDGLNSLPSWALRETLYRSGNSPSILQRHMERGGSDNLRRISALFRDHPNAIYTFDRSSGEGCFETVMRLRKPALLKVSLIAVINGTLDPSSDQERNFLTTLIPQQCRHSLIDIIKNYPSDYIVDILSSMTFMKVPFTEACIIKSGNRLECGSKSYTDPWSKLCEGGRQLEGESLSKILITRGGTIRRPAVLPLPGLGDMDFLATLLAYAPHEAFDNDALAVVLRVLWEGHIRIYYYVDCCLFFVYFILWVVLVEIVESSTSSLESTGRESVTLSSFALVGLNTLYTLKELVEGQYGGRPGYWQSLWNICDVVSNVCVHSYTGILIFSGNGMLPLAVATSLILTVKLLSYLRGFSDTSWLISVLQANFRDVRGFLIILAAILAGFSVAFRILFGQTGDESYRTLRRSFLSTFEMTIIGSYDPALLFEAQYSSLAVLVFILSITCILIVALNALISILADSYARVQENAVANRRRELASLCVEYMSLLPTWKRRHIESKTKWFHTLLEVDADGSLHVQTDAWEGGLNALRKDIEELSRTNQQNHDKAIQHLQSDLELDIKKFKKEVMNLLEDLLEDVKQIRKDQFQGLIKFDGQHVTKAVQAVKSVGRKGSALLKGAEE